MDDLQLAIDLDELASSPPPERLPAGVIAELERWVSAAIVSGGGDPSDRGQRRAFALGVVAGHTSTAESAGPPVLAWIASRPPVANQ